MFDAIDTYYRKLVPNISHEALAALHQHLTLKTVSKGQHLIQEGQYCNHVWFINQGFFRFYNTVDGKQIATGFIGSNEYISEYASFLTEQPAHDNIDAIEDGSVWQLHRTHMQELFQQFPVFETFARKLAEHLFILLAHRNYALLAISPEDRYQMLRNNQSALLQKIPQYMLASYLGITPEHLSRIRKKMANEKK
jgi:CRP/FNR family transcriptional regulator, anaerobic regulatory protein